MTSETGAPGVRKASRRAAAAGVGQGARAPDSAYVWIWLPGAVEPVVAGQLVRRGDAFVFNYGRSYLAREEAIALYEPELPLKAGPLPLLPGLSMPSSIRDASPDAWGRRVILNKRMGAAGRSHDTAEVDELTYLLDSGSDRIGALDFQASPSDYVARAPSKATLEEMMTAAERIEQGIALSPELDQALNHGTSIGGARPKALLADGDKKLIAKFSSSTDVHPVVKVEFLAMRLAARVGLDVAPVRLVQVAGRDVLLIERFDRVRSGAGWQRRAVVSALTMLELDEMMARYASYERLAEIVRHRFTDASATLRELFRRLVFNILVGNTDDHARNHAAFWDGHRLTLTPAYDICPQLRTGGEAAQAMLITGDDRSARLATCLSAASQFLLSQEAAGDIIQHQVEAILMAWPEVVVEARLTEVERRSLWGRQILNPYAFEGMSDAFQALARLAKEHAG